MRFASLNTLYTDLQNDGYTNVTAIGVGKSQYTQANLESMTNGQHRPWARDTVENGVYPIWSGWGANQRDLFILHPDGWIIDQISLNASFPEADIIDAVASNYPYPCDGDFSNADGCCGDETPDCAGVCGGDLELDCAGICGGDGSSCDGCFGESGDVNQDQTVNVLDVVALVAFVLNDAADLVPDPCTVENSDVNNDDTINVLDVVALVAIVLGM